MKSALAKIILGVVGICVLALIHNWNQLRTLTDLTRATWHVTETAETVVIQNATTSITCPKWFDYSKTTSTVNGTPGTVTRSLPSRYSAPKSTLHAIVDGENKSFEIPDVCVILQD